MSAIESCRTAAFAAIRAMRKTAPYDHRVQLLPQPALPKCQGGGRAKNNGLPRARPTVAGAVLSRGVHVARIDRRHRLPEQGRPLRSFVQGLAEIMLTIAADPKHLGAAWHHLGAAHLGLGHDPSPPRPP